MVEDIALRNLTKYVNAASDLAEALEVDIKKGNKISTETVLRLSKFVAAAKAVSSLLDDLDAVGVKLN
jgi:hypothetical protein